MQAELLNYADKLGLVTGEIQHIFVPLTVKDLIDHCPVFEEFFKINGFAVTAAAFYVAESTSPHRIHVDHGTRRSRINLPVLNCQHSRTVFYKLQPNSFDFDILGNGVRYYRSSDSQPREMASVTITKPTVINILEPHDVIVTKDNVRRIAITVGTDPEPDFLLE